MHTATADRFECILISEECGCAKPSEQIFLRACATTGASPANTAYVGDQYDLDAQAARQAGLLGVWLDRHGRATTHHSPPVIRTLDDLSRLLDSRDTPPNRGIQRTRSKDARR